MAEAQPQKPPRTWLRDSCKFGEEAFCPGSHTTFAQLEEDRNLNLPDCALRGKRRHSKEKKTPEYNCVTDAERLNITFEYEILVTGLRHKTTEENAKKIREPNSGFKGYANGKKINENKGDNYNHEYVWFSAYFERGSENAIMAENRATKIGRETGLKVQASSPFHANCFLYGPEAFCYSWEDIISAYKQQFCSNQDSNLRFGILGTFVYTQEIMHAIVVYSTEHKKLFENLPIVRIGIRGNRVKPDDKGRMYWYPESVIRINSAPFSPWERLSFAFHVPQGRIFDLHGLDLKDVDEEEEEKKEKGNGSEDENVAELTKGVENV